ncbi:winged helix-turn-helix domain-containing protein [Austwickia sp. TVS 96-490-7B]|uniref:winged helix-turn-helix domain-containing protein n=1 Tax=Austwickia sp. TVS 96-490-7B TaxID=2830843 RepID=UPI001C597E75|nr:winged helix-turn-helix domain-containing protein [Austwickia sp. TVS 96-490-7B]
MESSSGHAPTPEQLRGLAHPTRLKMLGLLRSDGPQTATMLAGQLGLNTGATSYHLRQLASHGYVTEAPELGTGRERWWRAAHRSTRLEDNTSPAAGAFLQSVVIRHTQTLQQGAEEFDELPDAWKRASTHSDWLMRLSSKQARELVIQISDLLTDAMHAAEEEPENGAASGDGIEQVMFQFHVFPRPGRIPYRTDADDPTRSAGDAVRGD